MTYDDIVNLAVPELPGIFTPHVMDAARESVREFCRDSSVWQITGQLLLVGDSEEATGAVTNSDAEIVRTISVAGMRAGADYSEYLPGKLLLCGAPAEAGQVGAVFACKPVLSASMPGELARWDQALLHLTLYRLKRMSHVEWSDPQAAAHHRTLYQEQLAEAKQLANTGHHFGARRVKPQQFI